MKTHINIDRKEPGADEINARKNFKSIWLKYYRFPKPGFNMGKLSGALIMIAAVAYFVFTEGDKQDTAGQKSSFITPPIDGTNVKFDSTLIDNSKSDTIYYLSGTRIVVPINSFVDEKGAVVKEPVKLLFREFTTAADILISGIPMTFDSAGTRFHFESAGMIEIDATSNGKKVYIANDKKIEINMASSYKDDRYNKYYLDTVAKRWVSLGKEISLESDPDKIISDLRKLNTDGSLNDLVTASQAFTYAIKEEKKLELKKPAVPVNADLSLKQIQIEVEEGEGTLSNFYADVLFQVNDTIKFRSENSKFSGTTNYENIEWTDVGLKQEKGDKYIATFKYYNDSIAFSVIPVYKGASFENANKKFAGLFKEFEIKQKVLTSKKAELLINVKKEIEKEKQKIVADRLYWEKETKRMEVEVEKEKANYNKKLEENRIAMEKAKAYSIKRMEEAISNANTLNKVTMAFSISRLGYYNSDCPSNLPKGMMVNATFVDNNKNSLIDYQSGGIKLIDKNRNAVFNYYPNTLQRFSFDPKAENIAIAVVNSKVYYADNDQFASLINSNTNAEFVMQELVVKGDVMEAINQLVKSKKTSN
jgi:hypothetical protein